MNRLIACLGIILGLTSSVLALEVKRDYEYYYIQPESVYALDREILTHAPTSSRGKQYRAVGSYQPKIKFNLRYQQLKTKCEFYFPEIELSGVVLLPRLKSKQYYSNELKILYQERYDEIRIHELRHERIYQEELSWLESEINYFIHGKAKKCKTVSENIDRAIKTVARKIKRRNADFDCREYGGKMGLEECTRFYESQMDDINLVNTGQRESTTIIEKHAEVEIEDNTCDGELIEPFKGKFYCITGEYKR